MREILDRIFGEWPEYKDPKSYLLGQWTIGDWARYLMLGICVGLVLLIIVLAMPEQP